MKVNKKLVPMKAHYFLQDAGLAPIAPFLPVIAKDLGFSAFVVGTIFTVVPLLSFLIKPLLGAIADKYQCQKLMFLLLLSVQYLFYFGSYWIPPLPQASSIICDDIAKFKICSDRLENTNLTFLNVFCKVDCSQDENRHVFNFEISGNSSIQKDNCIYVPAKMDNETVLCDIPSSSCKTTCNDTTLNNIITKVSDKEVMKYYQFWLLFLFIAIPEIACLVVISVGDTICLNLLGDRPMDFGLQRLWGAVGWGSMSLLSGLIVDTMSKGSESKVYTSAYYFLVIFGVLDFIISSKLDFKVVSKPPKSIIKDVFKVIKTPQIFTFMFWCFVNGIYTAMIWYFLFWFLEEVAANNGYGDMNYIKTLEGLTLTIHCYLGDIPFFFISSRLINKIGHVNAMTLVQVAVAVRFIYYSYLTNPWWTLPVETLSGISYGIFYTTMTTYASNISPPGTETTVQNLVAALFDGLGLSVGSFLGGYMIQTIGGVWTFWYLGLSSAFFAFMHFTVHLFMKEAKYKAVSRVADKEYELQIGPTSQT